MDKWTMSVYKSEEKEACCGCGATKESGVSTIYLPYCPCLLWVCDDCKLQLAYALLFEGDLGKRIYEEARRRMNYTPEEEK